ncbi:MAG: alpha/beta hydrolase [Thermoanaerobaculia bacterium]|nr:alpha/beta hydrolase [Thermoanaerobaculia bacterium]
MKTAVAVGLMILASPIDTWIQFSRQQLDRAGLEKVVTSDGAVYWRGGGKKKSETLVLLHGVNDQAGTWFAVVPALARDYRLIIPDLAGHGESEPKSGPITYANMLEQLDAILKSERSRNATLVGNSMGGWIAMLYAFDHPGKVRRLVLEDASGMAWPLSGVPFYPKNREEAAAMMRALNGPDDKTSDEVLDAFLARKDQPLSRFTLPDVLTHLVDARLSELKMPVTLIWGRDDGILPLAYAEALSKRIAGSKLRVIDGAAHIPHRQQPEKFVRCVKGIC